MSGEWYCVHQGQRIGPMTSAQLREACDRGQVADTDIVWSRDLTDWTPLHDVRARLAPAQAENPLAALGVPGLGFDLTAPVAPAYKPSSLTSPMSTGDRVLRALFVALAVGLAWGIRGHFGHVIGAMYPGAVLALAFAYVTGQDAMLRRMPLLAAAAALGIGAGGDMSYGLLHGYAQADTFRNYAYGFFTLFLLGGAWGCFGCAAMGILLEEKRARAWEWLGAFVSVVVCGTLLYGFVYIIIGFDVNPDRSNSMTAFVGGVLGLFAWLAFRKKYTALRGALIGFVGFGLGMAGGRLLGNVFHNMEDTFTINHWNIMEITVGLVGGFVFAFGMLGQRFPDRTSNKTISPLDILGMTFVLGGIPLLHRLTRIDLDKVNKWTQDLQTFGSSWTGASISTVLNVLAAIAFLSVAAWIYLQATEKERWGWFPVLALTLVMLLFQNFNALYYFYPHVPESVDMINFYWLILALMIAYVAVREYREGHTDDADPEADTDTVPWKPWTLTALAGLLLIILAAAAVNGPHTMKTAETRWPIWSHRTGPFR